MTSLRTLRDCGKGFINVRIWTCSSDPAGEEPDYLTAKDSASQIACANLRRLPRLN
jgi:hypothetical protein